MRPFTGFPDEQKCEFYNVDERFLSSQGLRKSEPGKQRSEARELLRSCRMGQNSRRLSGASTTASKYGSPGLWARDQPGLLSHDGNGITSRAKARCSPCACQAICQLAANSNRWR